MAKNSTLSRPPRTPHNFRRAAILFAGGGEALDDEFFGELLKTHRTGAERFWLPAGADRLGEQLKRQFVPERHDDDPFDVILQFPDISGPGVPLPGPRESGAPGARPARSRWRNSRCWWPNAGSVR